MLSSKQQYNFVLAIPIINVIADSTQNYFSPGLFSPGYLRALVILAFVAFHFRIFYRLNTLNNLIILSLSYYLVLGFFSSNIAYTQSIFLKFLIASIMFPVGYYYFKILERFRRLIRILMLVLGIYIIFLILSNLFLLGSSDYLEESMYFGSGRVNMTKAMMILVLISPLAFRFEQNKIVRKLNILIVVTAVIFILLGVKRSAVLGLFIGFFIYYIIVPQRTRVIKRLFAFVVILLLASPLYYNTLIKRFEARQEAGRFDLSKADEEEARVVEMRTVMNAFTGGNLGYKLFGAELFNGRVYFKTTRMLHTDYATMLSGSGLIGFGVFMLIFFLILYQSFYFRQKFKLDSEKQDIMAVSIVLIFAVMITGISGTVTAVGLRSIAFLFWGASFSYAREEIISFLRIHSRNR